MRCLWKFGSSPLLALVLIGGLHASPTKNWRVLDEGFSYDRFRISEGGESGLLHVFEIDPSRYPIHVVQAKDYQQGATTARALAVKSGALLVINASYFTPEFSPLGIIVRDGKILNPIHKTQWFSIFQIRGGIPAILPQGEFSLAPDLQVALQAGPRILIRGEPPTLKPQRAKRSAIAINPKQHLVIAITEGLAISMKELSKFLKEEMQCQEAMNLDGGSSSQLYAKYKGFLLDIQNESLVPNGLGVFASTAY